MTPVLAHLKLSQSKVTSICLTLTRVISKRHTFSSSSNLLIRSVDAFRLSSSICRLHMSDMNKVMVTLGSSPHNEPFVPLFRALNGCLLYTCTRGSARLWLWSSKLIGSWLEWLECSEQRVALEVNIGSEEYITSIKLKVRSWPTIHLSQYHYHWSETIYIMYYWYLQYN